jgi:hypothetical protein
MDDPGMPPAAKPKRSARPPRFVVVMSLLAAVLILPWAIGMLRGHRSKKRVVSAIQALEGIAISKYHFQLGRGANAVDLGPIQTVALLGPQVDDNSLKILQDAPELRILSLTNTKVTDQGLAQLGRMSQLECLYIANVDHTTFMGPSAARLDTEPLITGKGLGALKGLANLQVVQLLGPSTTDDDLQTIKQLKKLVLLDLVQTNVSEAAVAELRKQLPSCLVRRR